MIFSSNHVFCIEIQKTHGNFNRHHNHAKFKMAAMHSLNLSYITIIADRGLMLSPNHMFSVSKNTTKDTEIFLDITNMQNSKWPP